MPMIPRTDDAVQNLALLRRRLALAPWIIVLTYSLAALLWVGVSQLLIHQLNLPEWTYAARALVFAVLSAVAMWLFIHRLTRQAIRTQSLLSKAERGYRALFEAHPAPMWLFDQESLRIVKANEAAQEQYGYTAEAFIQRSVIDLYAPAARLRLMEKLAHSHVHSSDLSGIHLHGRADASTFDADVLCNDYLLAGEPYGLLMVRDISAQLAVQRKLRKSLEQLKLAQHLALLGYWEYRPHSGRLDCSAEVDSIFGIAASESPTSPARYLQAIHPEDRATLQAIHRSALRQQKRPHRYRVIRPDGEVRYVVERILLNADADSHEPVLFGTCMDITGLELAERRLASQQRLHERMLNRLPEGVLVVNDQRILYANPAAQRMLGAHSLAQLLDQPLQRFLPGLPRAAREQSPAPGAAEDAPPRIEALQRLDGRSFEAEVTEIPLEGQAGQEVQLLLRDISESLRMSRELHRANQRLQQLSQRLIEVQEQERRQLARDLHDDVGQQLTGLKLHLQRLSRKAGNDAHVRAVADNLAGSTDEALNKIRSLSLSLHPLQLENLGLEAAVRWHLAQFLGPTATGWTVTVTGELGSLPNDLGLAAFRIVQEAVSNVARHAEAGRVSVALIRQPEALRLCITDDGHGFDPNEARRSSQSLGLTSMQERVASLGGQLDILSSPGAGTQVIALLPINPPQHTRLE